MENTFQSKILDALYKTQNLEKTLIQIFSEMGPSINIDYISFITQDSMTKAISTITWCDKKESFPSEEKIAKTFNTIPPETIAHLPYDCYFTSKDIDKKVSIHKFNKLFSDHFFLIVPVFYQNQIRASLIFANDNTTYPTDKDFNSILGTAQFLAKIISPYFPNLKSQIPIESDKTLIEAALSNFILVGKLHGVNNTTLKIVYTNLPKKLFSFYSENIDLHTFVKDTVHPDDFNAISNLSQAIRKNLFSVKPITEHIEIRHILSGEPDHNYHWASITVKRTFNFHTKRLEYFLFASDIRKQKNTINKILLSSHLDPLTGLLNREAFNNSFETFKNEALLQENYFALLSIDLDNFKKINDTYGHKEGDNVLQNTAKCISSILRKTDLFSRFGGDEFIIILSHIHTPQNALDKAEEISQEMEVLAHELKLPSLSCSIGIAIFPDHGTSFEELYQNADIALYKAKKEGKNMAVLYSSQLTKPLNSKEIKK